MSIPNTGGMCSERQRLMQEYENAVSIHSDIRQTYPEAQWRWGFAEVLHSGERARIAFETARLAMESHIAEHGCGSRDG